MAKYINPDVIRAAMGALATYKHEHPNELLPLFALCKNADEDTRAIFVRAAQRLKLDVTRTRGHVYEKGQLIW